MTPVYRHEEPEPDAAMHTYIDLELFERYDAYSEGSARRNIFRYTISLTRAGRLTLSKATDWHAEKVAAYVNNVAQTIVLVPDANGFAMRIDSKGIQHINARRLAMTVFERLKISQDVRTIVFSAEIDSEGRLVCRYQRPAQGSGR